MLKLDGAIALAMAGPYVHATTLGVHAGYPECFKWSTYIVLQKCVGMIVALFQTEYTE